MLVRVMVMVPLPFNTIIMPNLRTQVWFTWKTCATALICVDGTSSSEIIDIAIMDGGGALLKVIPLELLVL